MRNVTKYIKFCEYYLLVSSIMTNKIEYIEVCVPWIDMKLMVQPAWSEL
jgi:hypothetical protein